MDFGLDATTWFIVVGAVFVLLCAWTAFSPRAYAKEGMANKKGGAIKPALAPEIAAAVKASVVQLQDELLVSKYRASYEETLAHMNDLIGITIVKEAMAAAPGGELQMSSVRLLADLNAARSAIEAGMEALDEI